MLEKRPGPEEAERSHIILGTAERGELKKISHHLYVSRNDEDLGRLLKYVDFVA